MRFTLCVQRPKNLIIIAKCQDKLLVNILERIVVQLVTFREALPRE